MRRFVFRLEGVLGHLRRLELAQAAALASAEREARRREDERDEHARRRVALEDGIRRDHAAMDREELARAYAHATYVARRLVSLEAEVVSATLAVFEARAELHDRFKRRRVVETLRERRRLTHDADLALLERAALDEANARRDPLQRTLP